MSLSSSSWASTLEALMRSVGLIGPDVQKFTGAVGEGSIKTLVGKSFASADVGSGSGGTGTGVGLIIPPLIATPLIISISTSSFGGAGYALPLIALALDLSMVTESLKASLESEAGVGSGAGTILPGTIPVTGAEWGPNITAAGVSRGFTGPNWPGFANAIGTGLATSYKLATGVLVIAGSGGDASAGAGKGEIS